MDKTLQLFTLLTPSLHAPASRRFRSGFGGDSPGEVWGERTLNDER